MIKNPLDANIEDEVHDLIRTVEATYSQVRVEYHPTLDEIASNLKHYLSSNKNPWPEYRVSVPWGMIRIEFSARIQDMINPEEKPKYRGTLHEKVLQMLKEESFNPVELEGKEGINFIGGSLKVAKLLDSNFPNHSLSVVESSNGGTILKLGERFAQMKTTTTKRGTKIYTNSQFSSVVKSMAKGNAAFSQFLLESAKAAETFATEDFAAPDFSTPTPSQPSPPVSPAAPTPTPSAPTPAPAAPQPDIIPNEFLQLINQGLHLLPPDVETMITNEIVRIQFPNPDPDPDPQPPKCKPVLKREPPDPRMTRIDSYNCVNSGMPNGDGFGWSIYGTLEEPNLFARTSTIKEVFKLAAGQPQLREISAQETPAGWTQNQTLPVTCAQLGGGKVLRLPSVSADAVPVKITFIGGGKDIQYPQIIKFWKDSADELFIEVKDYKPSLHAKLSFVVDIAHPNFAVITDKNALFSIGMSFSDYVGGAGKQYPHQPPLSSILQGSGDAHADKVIAKKNINPEQSIGSTLSMMYEWLWNWTCAEIPRSVPDIFDAYLLTNAGACRHRAYIMFLALNKLGLPCRFLGSTCHAWPEIWNPEKGMWMQLDLNGCDDPDKCPDCTIKNPWFGLREKCCPDGYDFNDASGDCEASDGSGQKVNSIDCPPCVPKPCPEDYYCDPRYNKCIPDCDKLFGTDYIFVGKRDACVNCSDEDKVYDYMTDDCECPDCPEDYFMDRTGHCVDAEGNLSETAPAGLYRDLATDVCLPKDDCDELMPGAKFNETTGRCECMPILDEEGNLVTVMVWSDVEGKCVEDKDDKCPDGQMKIYDVSLGAYRCVDIPEPSPIPPNPNPNPNPVPNPDEDDEEEEEEDLIMDDDKVVLNLTRWVNLTNGDISDTDPNDSSFRSIETKQCRLQGRSGSGKPYPVRYNVFADLHGLYEKWMMRDLDMDLVTAIPPTSELNPDYVIYLVAKSDNLEAAKEHIEVWRNSLSDATYGIFGTRIDLVDENFTQGDMEGTLYAIIQE